MASYVLDSRKEKKWLIKFHNLKIWCGVSIWIELEKKKNNLPLMSVFATL